MGMCLSTARITSINEEQLPIDMSEEAIDEEAIDEEVLPDTILESIDEINSSIDIISTN